jgi:hypothetical protein
MGALVTPTIQVACFTRITPPRQTLKLFLYLHDLVLVRTPMLLQTKDFRNLVSAITAALLFTRDVVFILFPVTSPLYYMEMF